VRKVLCVAAFTWLVAWGAETFATEPGDAAAGRRLAQRWCSECHQMDGKPGRVDSHIEAPNFVEIAKEPSITPLSLRVFFQSSHQNMPDFHISPSQADDLTAYVLSLKHR
jgi:cytochrome c